MIYWGDGKLDVRYWVSGIGYWMLDEKTGVRPSAYGLWLLRGAELRTKQRIKHLRQKTI